MIFMIFVVGMFVIVVIFYFQEFYCIFYGVLYFFLIFSMFMFLMIYFICNLYVVFWGIRENVIVVQFNVKLQKKKDGKIVFILNKFFSFSNIEVSEYVFLFGNLFKCFCCF